MANVLLAHPNYADPSALYTASYSGGAWETDLPLTNLSDRRLALVARSTTASTSSTKFDINLGVTRGVRIIAIPKHNLSLSAQIRIRGSNTAGDFSTPVYDTGTIDVYPIIYPFGTLPWGHPSFWTGKISSEDAAGYNIGFVHITPSTQIAQYWRFEISDPTNPDGYVDLARLFIASGYQPTINMSYGVQLGWETATTRSESDGGAAIFNTKAMRRNCKFVLEYIPEDEALSQTFEIQRRLGLSGQLYFVFDPDDTVHLHRRSFLAVQKELSPLDFPYFARSSVPFSLVEEL